MVSALLLSRRSIARLTQPWRWVPFAVRLRVAALRNRCIRYRLIRRAILLAVAIGMFLVWTRGVSAAEEAREQWGTGAAVFVVEDAIPVGGIIDGSLRTATLPVAAVPSDAIDDVDAIPPGATARTALRPGDIVRDRDLSSSNSGVPAGHRALAMPVTPLVPELSVGDHVELFLQSRSTPSDIPVAVDALVLQADAEILLLAVEERWAASVAGALGSGQVVVAAA